MNANAITPPVEARELLQRVASSPQFQKSKRLRELLLYLGDRGLKDPNCVLHEQEIGVDVLGRPSDYDTSHDTLVRVLISQLRKKLQEYFAGEGRDEPLIIQIPKGNYLPAFRPRGLEPDAAEIIEETAPPSARWWRSQRAVAWIALAALACAALAWAASVGAGHLGLRPARPDVEAFYSQLFANGQPTYLVLSDVSLMEFEMIMGGSVALSEYEAHEFDRLAQLHIPDPVQRTLALHFVDRVTTAVSDVQVARDFGVIASDRHLPLTIISARNVTASLVTSMNTILMGSLRANPWIGLFEDQFNFRTEYQETPAAMRFVNRSPRPGEQAAYPAVWRRTGYCRITFMPNPRHTGNVLIISGSDVISTEAGGRFLASEESMRQLRQNLGVKPGRPIPRFELLLRTEIVNSTVPRHELVAWRPR